jgi:hypothetical protein
MCHDEVRIADSSGSYEQVAPGSGQPPPPSGGYPVTEVTASSDDGNLPVNTLDDNLTSRWSTHGDGEWIRYDLGSAKKVTNTRHRLASRRPKNLEVRHRNLRQRHRVDPGGSRLDQPPHPCPGHL